MDDSYRVSQNYMNENNSEICAWLQCSCLKVQYYAIIKYGDDRAEGRGHNVTVTWR